MPPRLMATRKADERIDDRSSLLAEVRWRVGVSFLIRVLQIARLREEVTRCTASAVAGTAGSTTDSQKCKICFDRPIHTALVPCGHLCVCWDCSNQLQNCPICRQTIATVLRTYHVG